MDRAPREYLIGLNRIPEVTPRRMAVLLERFGSPELIWQAPVQALASLPGLAAAAERIAASRDEEGLDRELERAEREEVRIVTLLDLDYPAPLRAIEAPPAVLYLKGEGSLSAAPMIAVVGTRRSSGYGRSVAESLAADLARCGITILSGLAVGIDAAAHRGALKAGGATIAVLGSGLFRLYPAAHRRLAEEILERGLLVSEYPLDLAPAKWTFPQRNRILAGLVRGVVVVEAPERSGALITARLALEQGREVLAVPGNVTSAGSVGPNRLIRDGAALVEGAGDVLAQFPDLAPLLRPRADDRAARLAALSPEARRAYDLIGLEPVHIDDIIACGQLSPTEAAHALLVLQMENLIQELEGRRYGRTP